MPANRLREIIGKVATGATLSTEEMQTALEIMMSGVATPAQMGAFLMALRVRGETVEEITGAAKVMRERMLRVSAPADAVDEVRAIAAEIAAHLDDKRRGEILRGGVSVAIVGPPNAGKSSLLNRLARREAAIVGAAVVLTLTVTLFASWAWGFTLNRVSLFALIFSIGILVDDAIVVVENIVRHLGLPSSQRKPLTQVAIEAVDEVGNPTILATWAVIAAVLPMAFVSGMMGPYMRPIPIGCPNERSPTMSSSPAFANGPTSPGPIRQTRDCAPNPRPSSASWLPG